MNGPVNNGLSNDIADADTLTDADYNIDHAIIGMQHAKACSFGCLVMTWEGETPDDEQTTGPLRIVYV
jgi:hypothetical protein